MSLMDDALEQHLDILLDHDVAGEEIEIRLGSSVCKLDATIGKTDWDEPVGGEGGDTYIGTSSTDFIVRQSDIEFGGQYIEPKRGMVIVRKDGSQYAVMPGLNSAPAEPNDGREVFMRIHTQKRKRATS